MKTLNVLILMTALLSWQCARKPSPKFSDGTTDSLYAKDKFTTSVFTVGDIKDEDVNKFVTAAKDKESPEQLSLLTQNSEGIRDGAQVQFRIYATALRMYFVGQDDPIAQWAVAEHCNLERKRNENGEETRYVVAECNDGLNFDNYSYIRADHSKVTIRQIKQGTEHLVKKSEVAKALALNGDGAIYTLKTGKYIDRNIATSREFDEKLGKIIIKGSSLSHARELVTSKSFTGYNVLAPVEFSSPDLNLVQFNSELLKDVEVLGEESSEYALRLKLTEKHILIQKLVSANGLASTEKTYAEKINDDLYAVTLAGYPISKKMYVNEIANGEKTVNLVPIDAQNLDEATHVLIDEAGVSKFEAVQKMDVFHADFMKEGSEWYYEKTVVDRPLDTSGAGLDFAYELGSQWESGRFSVHKTKNSIQFVDVNIPKEAGDVNGDQMFSKLEIPASWVDYRVVSSGGADLLKEEELTDGHPSANQWDKRQWVTFEFNRADHMEDSRSDSYKLTRLEINDDYIGFNVYESATQVTFKYSLYRAKNSIPQGKTYFALDRKKFGVFARVQQYYYGITKSYENVLEKFVNIQRHYPELNENKDNTIWFYITNNSPEDSYIQEATQEAVDAWNRTFHKAAEGSGLPPINVKLAKERVELGDLRYNKVAYYGYDRASALLGYGPSVADARTGQIMSATNHIYLRNYREGLWTAMHHYVRNELGEFTGKTPKALNTYDPFKDEFISVIPNQDLTIAYGILGSSSALLGQDAAFERFGMNEAQKLLYSYDQKLPEGVDAHQLPRDPVERFVQYALSRNPEILAQKTAMDYIDWKAVSERSNMSSARLLEPPSLKNNPKNSKQMIQSSCEFGALAATANLFRDIKKYCENNNNILFSSYMKSLRNKGHDGAIETGHTEEEENAFTSCSDILLKKKLVATLVHEFGHNFGLRHNFSASTDIKNFPRDEKGNIKFMTASAMEYLGPDDDRGFEPGPYDIAAIRYSYYDMVEAVPRGNHDNGKVSLVKINNRPLQTAVDEDAPGMVIKPYAYCTDNDIESSTLQMPQSDPNCRKWDRGVTPLERAQSFMDEFFTFMTEYSYRFDREGISSSDSMKINMVHRYFGPLKIIYDEYRYLLQISNYTNDEYLKNVSSKEIDEYVSNSKDETLKNYHAAAQKIFEFFKAVAFSPIRYCALKNGSGEIKYFGYELLRQNIFNETRAQLGVGSIVNNCQEAFSFLVEKAGAEFAAQSVEEFGNVYDDIPWSPDADEMTTRPLIQKGMIYARNAAVAYLTERSAMSARSAGKTLSSLTTLISYKLDGRIPYIPGFAPSFLDESDHREELLDLVKVRSIYGEMKANIQENAKLMPKNLQNLSSAEEEQFFVKNFNAEANLYSDLYSQIFLQANAAVDIDRLEKHRAEYQTSNTLAAFAQSILGYKIDGNPLKALIDNGWTYITLGGGKYYLASYERQPSVAAMMDRWWEVTDLVNKLSLSILTDESQKEGKLTKLTRETEKISASLVEEVASKGADKVAVPNFIAKYLENAVDMGQLTVGESYMLQSSLMSEDLLSLTPESLLRLQAYWGKFMDAYLPLYQQNIENLQEFSAQASLLLQLATRQ